MPHFDAGELRAILARAGIDYLHLAELGGRRRGRPGSPNAGWENPSFRAYADHMASAEFEAGMRRLVSAAGEAPTAVMCAEALWWRCHRRLVADALLARGYEIMHVAPDGSTSAHELTGFAQLRGGRLRYPPRQGSLEP